VEFFIHPLIFASEAEVRPKAQPKNKIKLFACDKHTSLLCLILAETLELSGSVQNLYFCCEAE